MVISQSFSLVIHYVTKVWSDAPGVLARAASGGINSYISDHTLAGRPQQRHGSRPREVTSTGGGNPRMRENRKV
jgi:hypothetical protein